VGTPAFFLGLVVMALVSRFGGTAAATRESSGESAA
jgi:hypothetical protein